MKRNDEYSGVVGCIIGFIFIAAIITSVIALSGRPAKVDQHLQWYNDTTVVTRSDSLIVE